MLKDVGKLFIMAVALDCVYQVMKFTGFIRYRR